MRRRNETFREIMGGRIHSFGPGVNRKVHSLKSILSAELTQQTILELLTGHGIFVGMGFCPESNCNPDILMRGRRTGDKFALEYKYCFRYYYSEKYHTQTIRWARLDRIENYLRYQKEQNVLVYGVMGVENDILPGEPLKELFCVLLNDNKNAAVQIRRRISFGMCETKSFADEGFPHSFPLINYEGFLLWGFSGFITGNPKTM